MDHPAVLQAVDLRGSARHARRGRRRGGRPARGRIGDRAGAARLRRQAPRGLQDAAQDRASSPKSRRARPASCSASGWRRSSGWGDPPSPAEPNPIAHACDQRSDEHSEGHAEDDFAGREECAGKHRCSPHLHELETPEGRDVPSSPRKRGSRAAAAVLDARVRGHDVSPRPRRSRSHFTRAARERSTSR